MSGADPTPDPGLGSGLRSRDDAPAREAIPWGETDDTGHVPGSRPRTSGQRAPGLGPCLHRRNPPPQRSPTWPRPAPRSAPSRSPSRATSTAPPTTGPCALV